MSVKIETLSPGLKQKAKTLPTSWAEVTPEQLVWMVPFMMDAAQGMAVNVGIYSLLSGLDLKRIAPYQVRDILKHSEFLQHTCPFFIIDKIWPQPWKAFHLPSSEFRNLTALEYATFLQCLGEFLDPAQSTEAKEKALVKMISHLCRPADKKSRQPGSDDMRCSYNQSQADDRMIQISRSVSWAVQLAILWQFMQADKLMKKRYPLAMKPGRKSEDGQQKAAVPRGKMVIDMCWDLAEKSIFGNMDQTLQQPIHTLLAYVQRQGEIRKNKPIKP